MRDSTRAVAEWAAGDNLPAAVSIHSRTDESPDAVEVVRARREAGLSQRELADRLAVRLWTVDQWETGAKRISPDELPAIAAALGVTAERLLGREEAPVTEPSPELPRVPSEPVDTKVRVALTPEKIRTAELPRGLRGYDEEATRRLLDDIAFRWERMMVEHAKHVERIEELNAAVGAREDYDEVVSERAELHRRVEELGAVTHERDELRRRGEELGGVVRERDVLRRRVEELEAKRRIRKTPSRC